jgi:SAM-dependent methyltransferase
MERRQDPEGDLAWTGERLITGVQGDTALEHLHRYAVAMGLACGKAVLDIASGEGYGSSLLARVARRVIGVDIDPQSVRHATRHHARDNLEFRIGDATDIPVESSSIDLVVSFETLEHLVEQDRMLAEVRRVLMPGGVLIISTPDRRTYAELPEYRNPYHLRELDQGEFSQLIDRHFRSSLILGQRVCHGTLLAPLAEAEQGPDSFTSFAGNYGEIDAQPGLSEPIYLIAVASDGDLPRLRVSSLFEGRNLRSTADLLLEGRDQWLLESHQEVARSKAELEVTRGRLDHTQSVLEGTRNALDHVRAVLEGTRAVLEGTRAALEDREQRLLLTHEELASTRAALDEIRNSRSVRITAPLRSLGCWTRGARRRGRRILSSVAQASKLSGRR